MISKRDFVKQRLRIAKAVEQLSKALASSDKLATTKASKEQMRQTVTYMNRSLQFLMDQIDSLEIISESEQSGD